MQPYQRAQIDLTGRPPGLILHSSELADETNHYAVLIHELIEQGRGSKKLTDEQRQRKELLQWRGALGTLYINGQRIVLPTNNIFRSVVTAAKDFNLGTKIEDRGAVTFEQAEVPVTHDGPDDLDKLYADERYRFRTIVNGNPTRGPKGGKVAVMRPVFPAWSTRVTALVLTEIIDWAKFCQVMELAGNVGVGNGRKIGYGRYDVRIEKL